VASPAAGERSPDSKEGGRILTGKKEKRGTAVLKFQREQQQGEIKEEVLCRKKVLRSHQGPGKCAK